MTMQSDEIIPNVKAVPEENRLVRRAKAGDADAFMELFDVYADDLYRYAYFRVLSDVAAEAITSQVFRHAWDHLDAYRQRVSSFVAWIYEIARNQVIIYYKVNLRTNAFDTRSLLAAPDYRLNEEADAPAPGEAWGIHLRLLTGDIEQSRLQTTAALIMREYLDYLFPRRPRQPSPTFNAYTRAWLVRYVKLHARQPKISPIEEAISSSYATARAMLTSLLPQPGTAARLRARLRALVPQPMNWSPTPRQLSPFYTVIIAAFLVTGTARAQTALPGDPLYGWKRTSEQVWLSVSPDPVGTEMVLADRRLSEWMAVENDPRRSATAQAAYVQALQSLNVTTDAQTHARVLPMLEAHQKALKNSGVTSGPVYTFLTVAVNAAPTTTVIEEAATAIVPAATERVSEPPAAASQPPPTDVPATVAPPPTQVPPTETEVPPTNTPVPTATEAPPTDTPVPTETEEPPTPTGVPPTEVAPTATEVPPTVVAPTPVVAPTDIPVVPTDTPSAGSLLLPGG